MDDKTAPSNDMLQEFIDGQLNDRDQARVAAYLLANPEVAEKVRQMRRLNSRLKTLGRRIAREPVPDRLKDPIRRARVSKKGGE